MRVSLLTYPDALRPTPYSMALSMEPGEFNALRAMQRWGFEGKERMCAVIEELSRAIERYPADERLRGLRRSAYEFLGDPFSARNDVEFLAGQHPASPGPQLARCMYAEFCGDAEDDCLNCYAGVAALCEKLGGKALDSQEYILALLLAESPRAERKMKRYLSRLPASPANDQLREFFRAFQFLNALAAAGEQSPAGEAQAQFTCALSAEPGVPLKSGLDTKRKLICSHDVSREMLVRRIDPKEVFSCGEAR